MSKCCGILFVYLHRFCSLFVLLLASWLLAGCTVTISPFPEFLQRPAPEQVETVVVTANQPTKTFSWAVIGNSVQGTSLTTRLELDYVIAGFTFDQTFYDPAGADNVLSPLLKRYNLSPEATKLEYALINDGSNISPAATWTLYAANLPTQIVSPTFVLIDSTIGSGVPYTVTAHQPLLNKNDINDNCTQGLEAGLACLRTYGIDENSPNWLRQPPAFLLLSATVGSETQYILLWFGISPSGQQANPPDDDAVICHYCSTICDGQGLCNLICRMIC